MIPRTTNYIYRKGNIMILLILQRRPMMEERLCTAKELGYNSNKDVKFKQIKGIHISNFRTLVDRDIELGENVTIISGKNGTMKSCILGLIAHPFSSPNGATDSFGINLKTDMRDVFFLSLEKDNIQYNYSLIAETSEGEQFEEPIRVYPRQNKKESRHRVTVGKDNQAGLGNFLLNTAYVNLKRLYPIVETDAIREEAEEDLELQKFVADGYSRILQKEAFLHPLKVMEKNKKTTFSPSEDAEYDYKSVSSGEDNIGHILNKMYAFVKNKTNDDNLQGILCIDEIEASLHPVAQKNFLTYIMNWSRQNKVQVVITTHSLYLIQYALLMQKQMRNKNSLVINIISTAFVGHNNYRIIKNPPYEVAYKELTFEDMENLAEAYKINVLCEDEVAVDYLKKILTARVITKRLNFIHDMDSDVKGTSCVIYKKLIKNGERLLENSIVVMDPEVDLSDLEGKKASYIKLPSRYNLPIEKELVKYIHDLPGDDHFFVSFNKEQASFLNDFSNYGISDFSLEALNEEKTIKKFKNWVDGDKNFKKYLNYYAKHNSDIINPFIEQFLNMLNQKFEERALPKITI